MGWGKREGGIENYINIQFWSSLSGEEEHQPKDPEGG